MGYEINKNNISKYRWLFVAVFFVVAIIAISIISYVISRRSQNINIPAEIATDQIVTEPVETKIEPASEAEASPAPISVEKTLPKSAQITLWFVSQAPYGDWEEPWQNACEEASVIIAKHYFDKDSLTKEEMREEILALIDWQNKNFGDNHDLTSEETLELAKNYYQLSGEVIYEYNIDIIKQYIADGVPVIIPADGKKLGNPNFRNGGPDYHMLVVKGYNETQFITNDPGTRKGEGYLYSYQTIIDSIKNPTGGTKSILVLSK